MTAQLINYIKYELQTRKFLGLPGLGTLSLRRQAAAFGDENTTILPPSYKLSFESQQSDNIKVPQVLKNELLHLSELINNDLSKYGRSKIKSLGTFTKLGDKIDFTSDPGFESSYGAGLKPIEKIKIVSKTFSGEQGPVINTETLITKKQPQDYSGLKNLLKYFTYGIIAAGLLYAILNIKIPTSKKANVKQPPILSDTTSMNTSQGDTISYNSLSSDTVLFPNSNKTNEASIKPSLDTNNRLSKVEQKKINIPANFPKKEIPAEVSNSETPRVKSTTPVFESEEKSTRPQVKKETIKKAKTRVSNKFVNGKIEKIEGRPCVVVTGAFSKSTNTLKMIKQLQSSGYKVYTEEIGELTRVGIIYPCAAPKGEVIIEKVKNQINKDAWILKD